MIASYTATERLIPDPIFSPFHISPRHGKSAQFSLLGFSCFELYDGAVLVPVNDRPRNGGRILRGDEERAQDDVLSLEVDGFEVAAGLDEYGVTGGGGVDARLDGGEVAGHADDTGGRNGGGEKDEQADDEDRQSVV